MRLKIMKKIKYLIVPILLCLAFNVGAKENKIVGDIHVSVNGLVCDFCAQAISKVLNKEDAVEGVDVNMDKAMIIVDLKDGYDIDDKKLTGLIIDAGYNVEKIHRVK